ncbi:deoxyribodipyrimidine photo-lyase [Legionella sp. km772]|uniref:cryptochrome/photolyase family protein n=1 Tax=Legionella sp. km772 TaxID=2498111 RepID=UPI000F8F6830|nr:deoxyribodipyrimidine photo-lyase [Legionella sp. km772]RUR10169.1 deoxyribodipyrimidine photo-lyase [Legionella sp. km772]
MSVALIWFRQDLRCQDNPALTQACQHQQLLPLYIQEMPPTLAVGSAQRWWLHHSLNSLRASLRERHLDLFLRQGDALSILEELIAQHPIEAVYWNRCYEPSTRQRDERIKTLLKQLGIKVISFNGSLLHEPWEVLNKTGEHFKVFTPYWRQCLKQMTTQRMPQIKTWPTLYAIESESLADWQLLPKKPNWAAGFSQHWQPGEQGAWQQLSRFLNNDLASYKQARNNPGDECTSRLSPHLHFGELSPQQIWAAVQDKMQDLTCNLASVECFLSELGWREFSYQLLYHQPQLPEQNFKKSFDAFVWDDNTAALSLWQKGLTGYPIVDAGMRELWATGFMHNRVRMITASFLTKDLLIDWRHGAAWFWDTLVDADLANNSASWQWVAGSGADAAPYYRIFNPVLQGEKFDPQGCYVKRWLPELAPISNKWIHCPWQAPNFASTGYPAPIVDHALARQIALERYKQLKV